MEVARSEASSEKMEQLKEIARSEASPENMEVVRSEASSEKMEQLKEISRSEMKEKLKSEFMKKLLRLDYRNIMYNMENMLQSPWRTRPCDLKTQPQEFQNIIDLMRLEPALEGIDLGEVKHYKHAELIPYIDRRCGRLLSKLLYGRLFRGQVKQPNGEMRSVVIKTWDVLFPPTFRSDYSPQPIRLHNEMKLLMEEPLKSHGNVPNLIGYCIDKVLAVVYDLDPEYTLLYLLKAGLGWEHRMWAAVQVGRIVQSFHDVGITVGSIESETIMIDKEYTIYLCDFGPSDHELVDSPKVCTFNEKKNIDTYAYGILLFELFQEELIDRSQSYITAVVKRILSSEGSLVKKSFVDDENIRSEITKLVLSCLEEMPSIRPKVGDISIALEKFMDSSEDDVRK